MVDDLVTHQLKQKQQSIVIRYRKPDQSFDICHNKCACMEFIIMDLEEKPYIRQPNMKKKKLSTNYVQIESKTSSKILVSLYSVKNPVQRLIRFNI